MYGILNEWGLMSRRAMPPLLSTAVGSVIFIGSMPCGPFLTTIGWSGQFWNTGASLSIVKKYLRVVYTMLNEFDTWTWHRLQKKFLTYRHKENSHYRIPTTDQLWVLHNPSIRISSKRYPCNSQFLKYKNLHVVNKVIKSARRKIIIVQENWPTIHSNNPKILRSWNSVYWLRMDPYRTI